MAKAYLELVVGLRIRLVSLLQVTDLPALECEVSLGACSIMSTNGDLNAREERLSLLATRSLSNVISEVASRLIVEH